MSTTNLSALKTFPDRLEHLRGNATKAAFAEKIGISAPLYTQWLKGASPTYDKVRLIAERLKVSADWLLTGHEGVMTTLRYGFRERLFEAKGATGLDIPGLAKKLGVPDGEVEKLMNEGGNPTLALVNAFERHLQPIIEQRRKEEPLMTRLANIERLLVKLAGDQ